MGIPKPSCKDGKINASAFLYKLFKILSPPPIYFILF
jgi:hypothetical protein